LRLRKQPRRLAANNGLITEAQHYDDPHTRRSFMRTAFHDNGQGMPSLKALDHKFAGEVGRRFGMGWHFHEVERRCRALIAVSRQGHYLNSILHRWSTAALPIEVVAVVSNHQDMRSLAEWHGVPFHYLPIIDDRKAEQERRWIQPFERSEAELLVLARYMQILPLVPAGILTVGRPTFTIPFFQGSRAPNPTIRRTRAA